MKKITNKIKRLETGLGWYFSNPEIMAISQVTPITAGIAAYFSGKYSEDQMETLAEFVLLLNKRLESIEKIKIDRKFFETRAARRLVSNIIRSVLIDNRKEKIEAMANLTANLHLKTTLTIEEKELYLDVLDDLNPLQLSLLKKSIEMIGYNLDKARSFSWQKLNEEYQSKGVSKPLLLQSIRVLESNGLINLNTATLQAENATHFVTDFGEKFNNYISELVLQK